MFIANLYRFFTHVLTHTTKQIAPFERKPRISEITRPIKQNVNVSRDENQVNQARKYLRDLQSTYHKP